VNLIKFSGMQYRTDIGLKALAPLPFPIKEITPEAAEDLVAEPEA
jgi:hypothetical protein